MPILLYTLTDGRFMFGYAKPVPINPMNFKKPRQGMAISAAAGPITNIVLAFASFLIMNILFPLASLLPAPVAETVFKPIILILQASIYWNVVLGVLNMIPIPPLDGGRVLTGMLPSKQAMSFSKIEPFGFIIVLVLFYTGIANLFIMPVVVFFLKIFNLY
jgi:Zn-dependent protease